MADPDETQSRTDEPDAGPRIVEQHPLSEGFVTLTSMTVEVPWQGKTQRLVREIHYHGHVAAILPVDPSRGVGLLIRQFRVTPFLDGADPWLWEVPAGLLEGDPPDRCARKEAHEEAGIDIRTAEPLGDVLSSPGIVRECVYLFWGTYEGPPPAATGGLDHEGEMIEVHEFPLAEIARMAEDGEIVDAKSAIAVFRLKARRPDLFAA